MEGKARCFDVSTHLGWIENLPCALVRRPSTFKAFFFKVLYSLKTNFKLVQRSTDLDAFHHSGAWRCAKRTRTP